MINAVRSPLTALAAAVLVATTALGSSPALAATTPAPEPEAAQSSATASPLPATDAPSPTAAAETLRAESDDAAAAAIAIWEAFGAGTAGNAARLELAAAAYEVLGLPGVDLGATQSRIAETGEATVPTREELLAYADGLTELAGEDDTVAAARGAFERSAPATAFSARTSYRPPGVLGIDVSNHQGTVDWKYAWGQGSRFAYVKATEGTRAQNIKNAHFNTQYTGAGQQGMLRGAYHFALPASSSGAAQADYFVASGGGWSADGKTLPPLLDIESNPYSAPVHPDGKGDSCYGMTTAQLAAWIRDFGKRVEHHTGRLPMIYTGRDFWDTCMKGDTSLRSWPLHVAAYPEKTNQPKNPRQLPAGWTTFNMWQYTDESDLGDRTRPFDANVFNGDLQGLKDFAQNRRSTPYRMTTDYLGVDVWDASLQDTITRMRSKRLYGDTRYSTAAAVSKQTFPSGSRNVVVASGQDFPDALSASSLARRLNAPLLIVQKSGVPSPTMTELKRLKPSNVHIVGGTGAVTGATATKLAAVAPVKRHHGATRYETAADVASNFPSAGTVYLATGKDFPDALSLAAVAAKRKLPLLLTSTDTLPKATADQLRRLKPTHVAIAGGTSVVSTSVEAQIKRTLPNVKIVRFSGADRYATSAAIAKSYWPNTTSPTSNGAQRQFYANGSSFADGLTGAVAAAYNDAPLMLARKACLPASIASAQASMNGWTSVLVGGPAALSATAVYGTDGHLNRC
ncbi:cell wall-binding repeat-containing protein [Zhihengliuella halotolerans]|uniref:cell wall-binding repeat-containing protein n=1 Tax=Zhihengliuella halotolerans TaxID=370736 RepID=UPI000C807C2A|nr:cell wall-binding repeat-containing protein [Zhihengliuella halotolerans]